MQLQLQVWSWSSWLMFVTGVPRPGNSVSVLRRQALLFISPSFLLLSLAVNHLCKMFVYPQYARQKSSISHILMYEIWVPKINTIWANYILGSISVIGSPFLTELQMGLLISSEQQWAECLYFSLHCNFPIKVSHTSLHRANSSQWEILIRKNGREKGWNTFFGKKPDPSRHTYPFDSAQSFPLCWGQESQGYCY